MWANALVCAIFCMSKQFEHFVRVCSPNVPSRRRFLPHSAGARPTRRRGRRVSGRRPGRGAVGMGSGARSRARGFKPRDTFHVEEVHRAASGPLAPDAPNDRDARGETPAETPARSNDAAARSDAALDAADGSPGDSSGTERASPAGGSDAAARLPDGAVPAAANDAPVCDACPACDDACDVPGARRAATPTVTSRRERWRRRWDEVEVVGSGVASSGARATRRHPGWVRRGWISRRGVWRRTFGASR